LHFPGKTLRHGSQEGSSALSNHGSVYLDLLSVTLQSSILRPVLFDLLMSSLAQIIAKISFEDDGYYHTYVAPNRMDE
jgi:hypothetical protein